MRPRLKYKVPARLGNCLPTFLCRNYVDRHCVSLEGHMRIEYSNIFLYGLLLCSSLPVNAQRLKVVEKSGHLSPLMVKIVFMDNTSRTVMLRGVGVDATRSFLTHTLGVMTDGGASKRTIWLDSIAAIEGTGTMRTRDSEFTVILKNGKKVAAMFTGNTNCANPINEAAPNW